MVITQINEAIYDLLLETENESKGKSKTLIFVLGDASRAYFEQGLGSGSSPESKYGKLSSVQSIERCRHDIKVLFLNRLQYVFMFLTKLEAEKQRQIEYEKLVLYGLDLLISQQEVSKEQSSSNSLSVEEVKLANLTFNTLFRVKRKHELKMVQFIPFDEQSRVSKGLFELEEYWRYIS